MMKKIKMLMSIICTCAILTSVITPVFAANTKGVEYSNGNWSNHYAIKEI